MRIDRLAAVLVATMLGLGLGGPGFAVQPDEILKDPLLETRARDISRNLRCLVCQNQSIDDSDAGLARDLRLIVRERLQAGDSDSEVINFVVARYGDFVLLDPPFKGTTVVLWLGPAFIALAGILALILFYRRRPVASASDAPAPLSAEEERRLRKLLEGGPR